MKMAAAPEFNIFNPNIIAPYHTQMSSYQIFYQPNSALSYLMQPVSFQEKAQTGIKREERRELQESDLKHLIEQIRTDPDMSFVNLPGMKISDTQFIRLMKAICTYRNNKFHVYLSGNDITNVGIAEMLPVLKTNKFISIIDLSCNNLMQRGGELFLNILETNLTITELNLHFNQIPEGLNSEIITKLKRNRLFQQEIAFERANENFYVALLVVSMSLGITLPVSSIIFEYAMSFTLNETRAELADLFIDINRQAQTQIALSNPNLMDASIASVELPPKEMDLRRREPLNQLDQEPSNSPPPMTYLYSYHKSRPKSQPIPLKQPTPKINNRGICAIL